LEREANRLRIGREDFHKKNPTEPFPFNLIDGSNLLRKRVIDNLVQRLVWSSYKGFPKTALDAWIKALEARKEWRAAGFNYVPIEPIVTKKGKYRIAKNKDGTYRVYSRVLNGINLAEFNELANQFSERTRASVSLQVDKIKEVLDELEISHGHSHEANFVVVFFRGKHRVYLIDFENSRTVS